MGFNKSKSTSNTQNQAYPFLKDSLGGVVGGAQTAQTGISDLLSGNTEGFNRYKTATGFNRTLSQGLTDLTGASAARGLLRSGAAGKSFMSYGEDLARKSSGDYIQQLLGLGQLGIGAGQVIGGAGNVTNQKSSSKGISLPTPGLGG